MKILTLADEECKFLWDYYTPGKLREYDLIISCGDLKPEYLQFLVTMARCPLLYVHGNHDGRYEQNPPEGCDCIEDTVYLYKGLRILGLGGCKQYHPGPHQYTEKQMRKRIRKLKWLIRWYDGVDIVVTHAPAEGLGDADDPAHWGFAALREFLEKYKPRYLIHGHVHMSYDYKTPRIQQYGKTVIVNAYERFVLEVPEELRQDIPEDLGRWNIHHPMHAPGLPALMWRLGKRKK